MSVRAAVVCGCAALALRPAGSLAAVAIAAAVGAIGLAAPGPADDRPRGPLAAGRWLAVLAVGLAAFAVGETYSHAAPVWWTPAVLASAIAAVAEEAFFRRFVYGVLAGLGAAVAIAGAALLFALVHLPAYGAATLPINLAAGVLFGWQRWATGGWSAPALTHFAANVLHYTSL